MQATNEDPKRILACLFYPLGAKLTITGPRIQGLICLLL